MVLVNRKFGLLKSVRVLYQGELFKFGRWDYVTVISYEPLGLEKEGFTLTVKNIANIYLDKGDILGTFSRNTRNEILRTYKMPELRFAIPDEYKADEYKMYCVFEKNHGRKPWKEKTLIEGIVHFNAYRNGELISSIPCYDLKPILQVRAMFSKRTDEAKIASVATRRLIYEICEWAKAGGYKFVGLGAVNVSTEQKVNVSQFKMFFNPRIEKEYTYIRKPLYMKLWE